MLILRREVSNIKRPIAERENLIKAYTEDKLSKTRTAELLGCTTRTVGIYAKRYLRYGIKGLVDHRHSNNYRLTKQQRQLVIDLKSLDRWRSARNIRDQLGLKIHKNTIW